MALIFFFFNSKSLEIKHFELEQNHKIVGIFIACDRDVTKI